MHNKYAVISDNTIVNVILADSKEVAESVTQLECIEYDEENPVDIGYFWSEEYSKYISPAPFASWTYNGERWEAPVPYPEDDELYLWNEESGSWIKIEPEQ